MVVRHVSQTMIITYLLLRRMVVVKTVGGRAMAVHMAQMLIKTNIMTVLFVFGERGFMIALLLSRVMASMVNTLAGTVDREMNWLTEQ